MKYTVYKWPSEEQARVYIVGPVGFDETLNEENVSPWFKFTAIFPVLLDDEEAKNRAIEYRDYLNTRQEAMEKAASEVTIMNAVAQKLVGNR